ncbi:MAG: RNA polymerase sigma factor [Phycisphaerales bacterium]|nr:MAG: RNA polymerase sigma factor [Phycisphaerales bacterium]
MLWRLLGREADVLDAYQDCFCKLAHRRGGQTDITSARAYAYRTASNIAVELIRGRRRRQAHLPAIARARIEEQPDESHGLAAGEGIERLREAIAHLPAHLRNVIVLRDLSGLSYAEVGKTLGIEPATARVYRRHAVVKLAELLNEGEDLK